MTARASDDIALIEVSYREFAIRREGMIFAMDGGLWLHRHVWKGTPMAHLVSTDHVRLLRYGACVGLPAGRLQFKPLKDPRTGIRRDTWHWDLIGRFLPGIDSTVRQLSLVGEAAQTDPRR
jgi:hypothetical protein